MKRFFLVLTFLTLCLMLCASASADSAPMQLMRMNPLAFSKQPTRIESVTPTPDGSFVIIYFADSDTAGMQEMRLELFDAAGASLLSAALGDANLLEEGAPYPRGQVIWRKPLRVRILPGHYDDGSLQAAHLPLHGEAGTEADDEEAEIRRGVLCRACRGLHVPYAGTFGGRKRRFALPHGENLAYCQREAEDAVSVRLVVLRLP